MDNIHSGRKIGFITLVPPVIDDYGSNIGSGGIGGMSVNVADTAQCLAANGDNVTIFTTNQVVTDIPRVHRVNENLKIVEIPTGFPTSDQNELTKNKGIFAEGFSAYCIAHPEDTPDILLPNYYNAYEAAEGLEAALGEQHDITIIMKYHTYGKSKPGYVSKERIAEEERIAKSADGFLVSTPYGSNILEKSYGADKNKIYEVPLGVNTDFYKPIVENNIPLSKKKAKEALGISQDEYTILAVGRLDPLKNFDLLIEAYGMESMKGFKSNLYLIGGDSRDKERIRLVELSKENNIEVNFVNHMGREKIRGYYDAADVAVIPSLETFGLVALEAMACGTPVIAAEVGGLQYIVLDAITGYLVRHNNPISLANQLNSILEDDEMRLWMGENARKHAEVYDCDAMGKKFYKAIEKIQDLKLTGIKH